MADLTLYYAVPSRGMVVHWMLEELGQPYERKVLSLEAEEHKQPEFLALNPMGRVPVLTHGDRVVTETAAIVTYLADVFPEAGLGFAPDHPARGDFLRWIFFASVSAEPSIMWETLGEAGKQFDYQPFAPVADIAETLAAAVAGKEYVVADKFSAADVMIGTTIMWGTQMMPLLPSLPGLAEYWEGLSQRPAWQKAHGIDQALMAAKST